MRKLEELSRKMCEFEGNKQCKNCIFFRTVFCIICGKNRPVRDSTMSESNEKEEEPVEWRELLKS
jgi:hypothetical protein